MVALSRLLARAGLTIELIIVLSASLVPGLITANRRPLQIDDNAEAWQASCRARSTSNKREEDWRDAISVLAASTILTRPRGPHSSGVDPHPAAKEEIEKWFNALGDRDAASAYKAIWALVATPTQTVLLFQKRIEPVARIDPQRIRSLIRDLNDDDFSVRERASSELQSVAELAQPSLQETLKTRPTAEVRGRIERILRNLDEPITSAERLRPLRAIEVLEYIGTPEAQKELKRLAAGAPEARFTQEAKEALARLKKRAGARR